MSSRRTRHFAPPDTAADMKLGDLSVYAQLLWHRIHTDAADDQGRFIAAARSLKVVCVPYADEISVDRVRDALLELVSIEFVVVYQVRGEPFGQVIHWWRYQTGRYAYPSDLPAPPGWIDASCFKMRGDNKTWDEKSNWPPDRDNGIDYIRECPEALRLGTFREHAGNVLPIRAEQSNADQSSAGTNDET